MKITGKILLVTGLSLLFCVGLYCQNRIKEKFNVAEEKAAKNDPFVQLLGSGRVNNNCTTEKVYTITINIRGGEAYYTLYYAENELSQRDSDYDWLQRKNNGFAEIKKGECRGNNPSSSSNYNDIVSRINESKRNTEYIDKHNTLSKYINKGEVTVIESSTARNAQSDNISNSPVPKPVNRKLKKEIEINLSYLNEFLHDFYNPSSDKMDLCSYIERDFTDKTGLSPIDFFRLSNEKQREMTDLYNEIGQKYVDEANKIINENKKKFEEYLNKPEWMDIYNSVDNPQRFLSILNEAGRRNNNQLPSLIASDDKYYYLRLNNSDEMLSIAKQGNHIRLSPLGEASADFGLSKIESQIAGFGDNFREPSLQDVFVGGGVQYNLKSDGSFSDYSFYNDVSWSVGTRNAVKANLIDITHSSAPKLAVNRDATFYFEGLKYNIKGAVEGAVEISAPIQISHKKDGTTTVGATYAGSAGTDNRVKVDFVGAANMEMGENDVKMGVNIPLEKGTLNLGAKFEGNQEYTGVTVNSAINTKIAGVLKGQVGGKISGKIYTPIDTDVLLNQLPIEVEDKLYNSFLKNPNLQNSYRDEYQPMPNSTGGGVMQIPVKKDEWQKAADKLQYQIENRRKKEIPYQEPKTEWTEYVKPCKM